MSVTTSPSGVPASGAPAPIATRRTALGLALVALSTLMYEVLLTRIFSVTMWYHFAFVAISIAMFGMTVGALVVYLRPAWFPRDRVQAQLAIGSALFPIVTLLSFLTQLSDAVPRPSVDRRDLRDRLHLRGHRRAVRAERRAGVAGADAVSRATSAGSMPPISIGAALGCVLLVWVLDDHRRTDGGAGRSARSRRSARVAFALDEGSRPAGPRERARRPRCCSSRRSATPRSSGAASPCCGSSTSRPASRRARSTSAGTRTRASASRATPNALEKPYTWGLSRVYPGRSPRQPAAPRHRRRRRHRADEGARRRPRSSSTSSTTSPTSATTCARRAARWSSASAAAATCSRRCTSAPSRWSASRSTPTSSRR